MWSSVSSSHLHKKVGSLLQAMFLSTQNANCTELCSHPHKKVGSLLSYVTIHSKCEVYWAMSPSTQKEGRLLSYVPIHSKCKLLSYVPSTQKGGHSTELCLHPHKMLSSLLSYAPTHTKKGRLLRYVHIHTKRRTVYWAMSISTQNIKFTELCPHPQKTVGSLLSYVLIYTKL